MADYPRCVIITALMAEAVPMINFYRLQKQVLDKGVQLFCSDRIDLIVCGMGARRMNKGISAYLNAKPLDCTTRWLNLGTAGTLDLEVGELVWARSIAGIEIGWPDGEHSSSSMDVISLAEAGADYMAGVLFDMEAQACIDTLSENVIEFEPVHLFCAKVVSDNRLDPALKKDKHQVIFLLQRHQIDLSKKIENIINT